jgi:Rieske Fe-S protein
MSMILSILVVITICTHLGCVPLFRPELRSVDSALTLAGTTRDSLYEISFLGLYGGSCRGNGASGR